MMGTMGRVRASALTIASVALLWAAPVSAQTASTGKQIYAGVLVGVQSVQNVGGLVGLELGYPVSNRLDIRGEFTWLQNTVTRRRLGSAESVAAFLQQSQGAAATAALDAPAVLGGGSIRWFVTEARAVRPYLTAGAGVARVTFRPTFTLNGGDVTTLLDQYGVTLGSDLTGSTAKPAITAGVGVAADRGAWRVGVDLRVTSIRTVGQATNVLRLNAGIGRDF